MNRQFEKWNNFEKSLNISAEQEEQIQFEMDLIRATVEARKKANISQNELSRRTGIKQPAIARFENGTHSPTINTLIKMLVPMGYTLKIVPIKRK